MDWPSPTVPSSMSELVTTSLSASIRPQVGSDASYGHPHDPVLTTWNLLARELGGTTRAGEIAQRQVGAKAHPEEGHEAPLLRR